MRTLRLLAIVLGTSWICGCASIVATSTDFDLSYDFSGLRRYAWLPEPDRVPLLPGVESAEVRASVQEAVNKTLTDRGFGQSTSKTADFLIGYHAVMQEPLGVKTMNLRYGYSPGEGWDDSRYGRGWGYVSGWQPMSAPSHYSRDYDAGSLVLDVADARSRRLVWRSAARAGLSSDNGPEERDARIREAVHRMLELFPPH